MIDLHRKREIIFLYFAVFLVAARAQDYGVRNNPVRGQQQEDYSDDYGVAVNGGKSVKDKTDDDDGVPVTLCYVCHFERRQQDFQGTQDCDDPFHRSGIPQVACQGACGKLYYELANDYIITRSCMPKCMPGVDEEAGRHTHCCYSRLCNGSRSSVYGQGHLTVILVCLLSLSLTLWRRQIL